MNRENVIKALIMILKELQSEVSDVVEEISAATCPVGGMGHFDSLMGVVATARCFTQFEIKDDEKTVSLFETKKDGTALTVGDVADKIISMKNKELNP